MHRVSHQEKTHLAAMFTATQTRHACRKRNRNYIGKVLDAFTQRKIETNRYSPDIYPIYTRVKRRGVSRREH